jgi:hypothetical protein
VDVARRLCEDNQIHVNEIWSYHTFGEEMRFTLVHRSREIPPAPRVRAAAHPAAPPPARRKAPVPAVKKSARTAKPSRPKTAKKPTKPQKRK